SACQGSYLNGLIIVDEIKPAESKIIGQHPSKYGECDYWKSVSFISDYDVDTTYAKIIRSGVIDYAHLPLTNNDAFNINVAQEWKYPTESPGLLYSIPPRLMTIKIKNFMQTGVVTINISKNNRRNLQGSVIDVEYCRGGKYDIGYYVPYHLKEKFEYNLKAKFQIALK
ncbi:hypothetical protein MNBD_GAMMA11-3429, partial [hydrothermal vent metagenome]